QDLVIGSGLAAFHDLVPIDRQDLVLPVRAVMRRRWTSNPDTMLGSLGRQAVDLAEGVEHGFVAGYRPTGHLLAEAAAIGDHVEDLAIVSQDVERDFRLEHE